MSKEICCGKCKSPFNGNGGQPVAKGVCRPTGEEGVFCNECAPEGCQCVVINESCGGKKFTIIPQLEAAIQQYHNQKGG